MSWRAGPSSTTTPEGWRPFPATGGCAALTLGLVYRWGEVFPSWGPALGGRRVPTPVALGAALLGVLAVGAVVV